MNTITPEQQTAIADFLKDRHIPKGLGTRESACSIAAINLALFNRLTDDVPPCMSRVIGRWIIRIQDAMPDTMRNSAEWRALLPLAAGTGRDREPERAALVMAWMWDEVLPQLQGTADKHGFGAQWRAMCEQRTTSAAAYAARAAYAADAARATYAAAYAAADATARAAYAADARADAAAYAAADAVYADAAEYWQAIDPVALLRTLIEVE